MKSTYAEKAKIEKQDITIDGKESELFIAVDLFSSQLISDMDVAAKGIIIDHHELKGKDAEEAQKLKESGKVSPYLFNLEKCGSKLSSKYIPASALTPVILEFALKKMGIKNGLSIASETENTILKQIIQAGIISDRGADKGGIFMNTSLTNDEVKLFEWIASSLGEKGHRLIENWAKLKDKILAVDSKNEDQYKLPYRDFSKKQLQIKPMK